MTLHNPVWLHADSYDAVDFRNAISSLLNPAGGVVGSGDYQVSAPSSGMSVNVAAGQVWVPGTQAANQGQYYMLNDGTVSVTVPAADSTNPRIDLIVAQVIDTQYGGASNTGEVVDVSGTPAASPAAPAAPANSITLAQVYVGAGVTSIVAGNITDERVVAGVAVVKQPVLRAHTSSAVTIATNATTTVLYQTVDEDTASGFDASTGVYTVPSDGIYMVTATMQWPNINSGTGYISMELGGIQATVIYVSQNYLSSTMTNTDRYAANGTITVGVYNQVSASIVSGTSAPLNYISIIKLSD